MYNRFKKAIQIWEGGASNPRAVARELVEAMDQATETSLFHADKDPAVKVILDHLCFLCGMPQPSMAMEDWEWDSILQACRDEEQL
jgi:hypothetical protein